MSSPPTGQVTVEHDDVVVVVGGVSSPRRRRRHVDGHQLPTQPDGDGFGELVSSSMTSTRIVHPSAAVRVSLTVSLLRRPSVPARSQRHRLQPRPPYHWGRHIEPHERTRHAQHLAAAPGRRWLPRVRSSARPAARWDDDDDTARLWRPTHRRQRRRPSPRPPTPRQRPPRRRQARCPTGDRRGRSPARRAGPAVPTRSACETTASPTSPTPAPKAHSPRRRTLGINPDSPQFQAADEACKHLMPPTDAAAPRGPSEAMLAYAQCMRDEGIAASPTPTPTGGSNSTAMPSASTRRSSGPPTRRASISDAAMAARTEMRRRLMSPLHISGPRELRRLRARPARRSPARPAGPARAPLVARRGAAWRRSSAAARRSCGSTRSGNTGDDDDDVTDLAARRWPRSSSAR